MTTDLIARLCQMAAPPKEPLYNHGDWDAVERDLGVKLPEDYKRLIETFGQGGFVGEAFCSGLLLASYLGPARPVERAKGFSAVFRTVDRLSYGLYPDKPGLLGFGSYADKDTVAWNTVGSPEGWTIIWHDPETGIHEVRGMGVLEFVVSVLEESSPLHKTGVIQKGNMKGPHTFCPEP
jgi:hypothetical protein